PPLNNHHLAQLTHMEYENRYGSPHFIEPITESVSEARKEESESVLSAKFLSWASRMWQKSTPTASAAISSS
ncbi:MAG: hypothetical protein AAF633_15655, partial [Chloroflexota bacterium]